MALLTMFLIILTVVGLIVGIPFAIGAVQNSRNRLDTSHRQELASKRELVKTIERLCIENQDVNPELAYQIRDEIRTYELKELN